LYEKNVKYQCITDKEDSENGDHFDECQENFYIH